MSGFKQKIMSDNLCQNNDDDKTRYISLLCKKKKKSLLCEKNVLIVWYLKLTVYSAFRWLHYYDDDDKRNDDKDDDDDDKWLDEHFKCVKLCKTKDFNNKKKPNWLL